MKTLFIFVTFIFFGGIICPNSAEMEANATEPMDKNSTELMDKNSTELMDKNSTEPMDKNSTESIDKNSTELIEGNTTESMGLNSTETKENATEPIPEPEDSESSEETMEEEAKEMDDCKMCMKDGDKSIECKKVDTSIESLTEMIKELRNDVKMIKDQMASKCSELEGNESTVEESEDSSIELGDSSEKMNATELEEDLNTEEDDIDLTTTPFPTECDAPFQPVAEGCYFFLIYPEDWRNWGDGQAYCQSIGGTLANPSSLEPLRDYLILNFYTVFWIGGQKADGETEYKWYNGEAFPDDEWAKGQPSSEGAARNCILLDQRNRYKAMSDYCGQKFPFICQRKS